MLPSRLPVTLPAALLALALTACGGSSGPEPEAPPPVATHEVPSSAFAGTEAFTRFAASLPSSESAEPLGLGPTAAPTSETEEPRPL